jgi:molybdopterin converting factor small subunit
MKVRVRLYAFLAEQVSEAFQEQYPQGVHSGSPLELNLPEGSNLATLVDHLALPEGQVKLTVVNGRLRELDYRLQPEDEVGIFPPIAGG